MDLAWDGKHLWHADADTNLLYQMHPGSGETLRTLPCAEVRTGLSYDGRYLWQVAGRPKRIRIIAPETCKMQDEIPLGERSEAVCGLLVTGDAFWTGPESDDYVEGYSQTTGKLVRRFGPVASGDGLALVNDRFWYTSYRDGALVALDAESGIEVRRCRLSGSPTDLCWDGTRFWYNDFSNKQICAVQPHVL